MLGADQAKERLQEILSRAEYKVYEEQKKSFIQAWWESAKEWMARQLGKLFPSYESASTAAGPVLTLIIVLVVIGLGVAAYFVIRNTRRARKYRDQSPIQSMKELDWTYTMHLSEALKRESEHDYSHAARHLFLAVLLYFHSKEWLEARIWKTNWEYYDELKKVNKTWADQFYHLARVFDEVTYGERQLGIEEYESFRAAAMKWLEKPEESMEG